MNGLPYYKAYPRDFYEGTVGMEFEVKAAYRLILDLIYMHGGRLADDQRFISGHLGCSVKKWWALRSALLATGKITLDGDHLANHRADKVLDEAKMFQSKQRDNARQPKKNKGLTEAMAEPKASHTDTDTEEEKREAKASPKKARGSRLSPDWFLPVDWGDWALSEGMGREQIRAEADKFKDYWHARAGPQGVKLDWLATWRNWIRTARDRQHGNGNAKGERRIQSWLAGSAVAPRVDSWPDTDPSQPLLARR